MLRIPAVQSYASILQAGQQQRARRGLRCVRAAADPGVQERQRQCGGEIIIDAVVFQCPLELFFVHGSAVAGGTESFGQQWAKVFKYVSPGSFAGPSLADSAGAHGDANRELGAGLRSIGVFGAVNAAGEKTVERIRPDQLCTGEKKQRRKHQTDNQYVLDAVLHMAVSWSHHEAPPVRPGRWEE